MISLTKILLMIFSIILSWFLLYCKYTKDLYYENKKLKIEIQKLATKEDPL